ncbi:hypothetical protein DJ59_4190 [Yersinia enterocolitica]|nr:hypothetical protein DJ59_4190 [Yersinia enterocolitica]
MPEPGILEPRVSDNDDSGLRIHCTGKSIEEGFLYLRILLFF